MQRTAAEHAASPWACRSRSPKASEVAALEKLNLARVHAGISNAAVIARATPARLQAAPFT